MKNRLGITEGEWIVDKYDFETTYSLRLSKMGINSITNDQSENNRKLIVDAGNTAQKCGLLPSELLEQRDVMLRAIEKMCAYHEKMATWDKGDNGYYAANNLIKKIKGE